MPIFNKKSPQDVYFLLMPQQKTSQTWVIYGKILRRYTARVCKDFLLNNRMDSVLDIVL